MRPTSWILASLVLVVGAAAPSQEKKPPKGDGSDAAQVKELADVERQIAAKEKELADLRARADALRAAIGKAKPPAIVGTWEITSSHTTQAGLFQMVWGVRRRETTSASSRTATA